MVDPIARTLRCLHATALAYALLGLGLVVVFAAYGEYNSATLPARVMGVGLGLFLVGLASGIQWVALCLKARLAWAWGAALGIFALSLPSLLLTALGYLGLKALLASETRDWAFNRPKAPVVPPPFRHTLPSS